MFEKELTTNENCLCWLMLADTELRAAIINDDRDSLTAQRFLGEQPNALELAQFIETVQTTEDSGKLWGIATYPTVPGVIKLAALSRYNLLGPPSPAVLVTIIMPTPTLPTAEPLSSTPAAEETAAA